MSGNINMVYKRKFGIDLLRIIAMFMIVVLHVIGEGGVLESVSFLSDKYMFIWLLKILSYCAVDCYAMISGYVMFNRKVKLEKIISLWLQILFYSFGIYLFFYIFDLEIVSNLSFLEYLFPISNKLYWYLTAYLGLMLFSPLLNLILEKFNKKAIFLSLFNIIGFISVSPFNLHNDTLKLDGGYSFIWLVILYLIGGALAKYEISKNITFSQSIGLYLFGVFTTWFYKMGIEILNFITRSNVLNPNLFLKYVSITVVVSATGLLLYFSKLNINNRHIIKAVSIISPLTLGVYLIHSHPTIYYGVLHNSFRSLSIFPVFSIFILIFICSVSIFIICLIIEQIRITLFKSIHIDRFCMIMSEKIVKLENELYLKFCKLTKQL